MKLQSNNYLTLFTLITLFVSPCSLVHGQQVGIYAGLSAAQFSQAAPFNRTGYGLSTHLTYEHKLPLKNLSYSTGIGYTQIRGNGTVNYYNLVNDVVLSYDKMQALHYLQLPFLLKYNLLNTEKYNLGVEAGMQYNFLLTAWQNPQRVNVNHDVTDQFVRNLLSYQMGLTYTKSIAENKQIHINLTYQRNATCMQKGSNAGFDALVIGIGYSFGK